MPPPLFLREYGCSSCPYYAGFLALPAHSATLFVNLQEAPSGHFSRVSIGAIQRAPTQKPKAKANDHNTPTSPFADLHRMVSSDMPSPHIIGNAHAVSNRKPSTSPRTRPSRSNSRSL